MLQFPCQMQSLTSRRELVELLDSEPLFDYLIQNGVLDKSQAETIQSETSPVKVNLALLQNVEESGKMAQNLFINALRQSGQHYLANMLDEGTRIKALTGSGFLSKSRHKGQVSLRVKVQALKLEADLIPAASPLTYREWISLEDVQVRLASLTRPKPISIQPLELEDPNPEQGRSKCCLCSCFSRLFMPSAKPHKEAKPKPRKKGSGGSNQAVQQQVQQCQPSSSNINMSASVGNINGVHGLYTTTPAKNSRETMLFAEYPSYASMRTPKENRNSVASLRNLANTVQEKSEVLYEVLRDPNSPPREAVVKYFEQDRGVLILNATSTEGFIIEAICMKLEQLQELRDHVSNGKLAEALQKVLVTEKVLEQVGATAIHLEVDINNDEFELAEQELS